MHKCINGIVINIINFHLDMCGAVMQRLPLRYSRIKFGDDVRMNVRMQKSKKLWPLNFFSSGTKGQRGLKSFDSFNLFWLVDKVDQKKKENNINQQSVNNFLWLNNNKNRIYFYQATLLPWKSFFVNSLPKSIWLFIFFFIILELFELVPNVLYYVNPDK